MKITYTKHAQEMLVFRKIKKEFVDQCVKKPDQILSAKAGKSLYIKDFGTNYLKVIGAKSDDELLVVTLHWLAKKRLKM